MGREPRNTHQIQHLSVAEVCVPPPVTLGAGSTEWSEQKSDGVGGGVSEEGGNGGGL